MNVATHNRARTAADIRSALRPYGWVLDCSPRYNRDSGEYGAYYVYDPRRQHVVFGTPFGATLDLIDTWLTTLPPRQSPPNHAQPAEPTPPER